MLDDEMTPQGRLDHIDDFFVHLPMDDRLNVEILNSVNFPHSFR